MSNLEIPEGYTVDRYFLLHECPELAEYLNDGEYEHVTGNAEGYKVTNDTHVWEESAINQMVLMRNKLAEKVLNEGYEWYLMVDSDIVMHPFTLIHLLHMEKKIIAEIFWTKETPESNNMWSNAWHYNQCDIVEEEQEKWFTPGIYKVGGTGACILIHRSVFEAGVNYNPIYNVKLMGEDRNFCIRAAVNGFDIWIDTHFPAIHLYREHELKLYDPTLSYEKALNKVLGGIT